METYSKLHLTQIGKIDVSWPWAEAWVTNLAFMILSSSLSGLEQTLQTLKSSGLASQFGSRAATSSSFYSSRMILEGLSFLAASTLMLLNFEARDALDMPVAFEKADL